MVYIKGGETYPGYKFNEEDPIRFSQVVQEENGRPLFRRSMAEIDDDISMAMRAEESLGRSLERRGPKRYESRFVVEFLDDLDDAFKGVGKAVTRLALRQMRVVMASEYPSRTRNT